MNEIDARNNKSIVDSESTTKYFTDIGAINPFTILVGGQFNSFIANLSKGKLLTQIELDAFNELWNAFGIDIGGTGNNLWNLKFGNYEIFSENNISIRYEKKNAGVRNKYSDDNSIVNFIYSSQDGGFIISQNDRNKDVFLVYTSENISERLLEVLQQAEAESLNIVIESITPNMSASHTIK